MKREIYRITYIFDRLNSESKKKRSRTIFSSEQLKSLEQHFKKQQYIVGEERTILAECLKLTETQVGVQPIAYVMHFMTI